MALDWNVMVSACSNGVLGGNSTFGTISSLGLYRPMANPNPNSVTLRAMTFGRLGEVRPGERDDCATLRIVKYPSSALMSRTLLILRLSALGDVIHTIPAVVALRDAFPDSRIGWIVERPYESLVRRVAPVDEVFTVATKRWRREASRRSTRSDLATLRKAIREFARGETSIDFQGLVKSASLGWMSGARHRYGFDRRTIREKPALLFTNRRVVVDPTQHVIEQNLALARAAGAKAPRPPEVDYSRFLDGTDAQLRAIVELRPVVFLPGSGRSDKQWPVESYARLAQILDGPIVSMWGPGEEDLAMAIEQHSSGRAKTAPPSNLQQLAYVLKHARLVIGGDTGPLHLAAALGTRVLALFGPTNPARNGPYGQIQDTISTWSSSRSMSDISPMEVAAAVRSR